MRKRTKKVPLKRCPICGLKASATDLCNYHCLMFFRWMDRRPGILRRMTYREAKERFVEKERPFDGHNIP